VTVFEPSDPGSDAERLRDLVPLVQTLGANFARHHDH